MEPYALHTTRALKFALSTKSHLINLGGMKNKVAEGVAQDDKDAVIILAMKYIEELGMGRIGGHRSSITLLGVPPQHVHDVPEVLSRLAGVDRAAVSSRLKARPAVNEAFNYDQFRRAAAKGGIPEGPLPAEPAADQEGGAEDGDHGEASAAETAPGRLRGSGAGLDATPSILGS